VTNIVVEAEAQRKNGQGNRQLFCAPKVIGKSVMQHLPQRKIMRYVINWEKIDVVIGARSLVFECQADAAVWLSTGTHSVIGYAPGIKQKATSACFASPLWNG
jgi:hypothetical protein